ncbi:glycoside hydrolase family 18 protein [Annulohypoxylon truncatum]|uniref:glycoside hydrolase family 18 protein n=1 Tax=Annulohypoxylon truncatum TaxID=327061 RepID=UPI002007A020|nr:glycoside hydrolase family 18 protein [Annulohypoxylon truncatum]KAI1206307.1 glycoside hydrolase family 18 protein [Annulohypoxylon truncatum]
MASQSSPARPTPRIIMYYQTTHDPDGNLISTLPLITQPGIALTHLIVAAIHINEDPDGLTLNDHAPSDPRYTTMWAELRIAQASDVKVLGMLGGAAQGSFARLDQQDQASFETYYAPLHALIRERGLDGLDLDIEEEMSLAGAVRLIDRLRADFGPNFLITLAPVAAALLDPRRNLSGFDYEALEVMRGPQIAWYNAQFYCGWGDAASPAMYQMCVARGWPAEKVVIGLVTTPENGPGWVPFDALAATLALLRSQFPGFGGVMGWEYFNGLPGGQARPWEWAQSMTRLLGAGQVGGAQETSGAKSTKAVEIDPDAETGPSPEVPQSFEYYSDGLDEGDD